MARHAAVEAPRGEDQVLLQSQGFLLQPGAASWRIGELSLTGRRFAFTQGGRSRFELQVPWITAVAVERRKFIVLRKEVVRLSYALAGENRGRQAWFITADLSRWLEQLMTVTNVSVGGLRPASESARSSRQSPTSTRPRRTRARDQKVVLLREDQVQELAAAVGPQGARVLWHLWRQRHAGIEELADLIDARSHMDVLTLIREGINEPARHLLGGPALSFKECALDRSSGHSVCFHWWLERADDTGDPVPEAPELPEPLVEIHDEGEALLVVVSLPGCGTEAPTAEVSDDRLLLAAETVDGPCELTVALPCTALATPARVLVRNGVVSLWLAKS